MSSITTDIFHIIDGAGADPTFTEVAFLYYLLYPSKNKKH